MHPTTSAKFPVPQLLVSVRSAAEYELAQDSGVRWIDLKDPGQGSLGAPALQVASDVLKLHASRLSFPGQSWVTSIALGELLETKDLELMQIAKQFDFAKVALAGCAHRLSQSSWIDRARWLSFQLEDPSKLILVHYADLHLAHSPPFEIVLATATELGCRWILVDTYDKQAGRLGDWYSDVDLGKLLDRSHACGIQISLAGSLRRSDLIRMMELCPDLLAVRGAACLDDRRTDKLSAERVCELVKLFQDCQLARNHATVSKHLPSTVM